CTDEERFRQAEELVTTNHEAAELFSKLQATTKIMDSLRDVPPCPDALMQATLMRLSAAARSSQLRLTSLLDAEQKRSAYRGRGFLGKIAEVAAVAAVVTLLGGAAMLSLRHARDISWQTRCAAQLSAIARGITQYEQSNNAQLPLAAMQDGSPWWKVGYQGQTNESNTRQLWLLVKGGYVQPGMFVCPASPLGNKQEAQQAGFLGGHDFPSRRHITYSLRIVSIPNPEDPASGRYILLADVNPIFEKLPENFSQGFLRVLNNRLMRANSINHGGRGQNVLLSDNSVEFLRTRIWGPAGDDIYTVEGKDKYYGHEVPASAADIFLAP
ncbi:MAG TPA: hypothetical protein VLH60_06495, partial [Sedimentisphaerales bacterium]|nr:hypothetical protein [Sedimentisphaerales bacterium]